MNRVKSLNSGSVVLSAHSDDAALSIGCLLQLDKTLSPITLVTVFSRSDFAPFENSNDTRHVSEIRSKEDNAFAKSLGCNLIELNFTDARLRNSEKNTRNLFNPNLKIPIAIESALITQISKIVNLQNPRYLIGPLALGNHIDHRILHQAACKVKEPNQMKKWFYEDQPYAMMGANLKQIQIDKEKWTLERDLNILNSLSLRNMKLSHASHYPSQPASHTIIEALQSNQTELHERLWVCRLNTNLQEMKKQNCHAE